MADVKVDTPKRTTLDIEVAISRATQRDWLIVQQKLEMSRKEITDDEGIFMVFLAWLLAKQAHGGADLDTYLDMPFEDLMAELNMEEDEDPKALGN